VRAARLNIFRNESVGTVFISISLPFFRAGRSIDAIQSLLVVWGCFAGKNDDVMKTKTWLWIVVSVLAAAGAVWWLWRSQTFTLNDGTKLKLVAWNTASIINFPASDYQSSAFDSTNDTLVVWIEQKHKGNDWPNYQLYAYDKSATACVGMFTRNSRQIRQGDEMIGFQLDAFPRRQGKFLSAHSGMEPAKRTAKHAADDQERLRYFQSGARPFPGVAPGSAANTQEDGDLSVTLDRLEFGAKAPYTRNPKKTKRPDEQGGTGGISNPAERQDRHQLAAAQVETSDATGNHITGWCNSHWENDEEVTLYQYGLWPDEPGLETALRVFTHVRVP